MKTKSENTTPRGGKGRGEGKREKGEGGEKERTEKGEGDEGRGGGEAEGMGFAPKAQSRSPSSPVLRRAPIASTPPSPAHHKITPPRLIHQALSALSPQ